MGKRSAVDTHLQTPNKRAKYDGPVTQSPVPEQTFVLNQELVDSAVITDIKKNKWRVGKPFGKFLKTFYFSIISYNYTVTEVTKPKLDILGQNNL